MKSRSELLTMATKAMEDEQAKEYDMICRRIENAASCGITKVKVVVGNLSSRKVSNNTRILCERLKSEGFFVRCGWEEVTSGGICENYIEVSLLPFQKEPLVKRWHDLLDITGGYIHFRLYNWRFHYLYNE